MKECRPKEKLANFHDGDYVLIACENLFEKEKLCLGWKRPHRVLKALNDHIYLIEDLQNGYIE